ARLDAATLAPSVGAGSAVGASTWSSRAPGAADAIAPGADAGLRRASHAIAQTSGTAMTAAIVHVGTRSRLPNLADALSATSPARSEAARRARPASSRLLLTNAKGALGDGGLRLANARAAGALGTAATSASIASSAVA